MVTHIHYHSLTSYTPPRWHAAQESHLEREVEVGSVGVMAAWAPPGEVEAEAFNLCIRTELR